jgi:hypothetical protein
MDRACSIHGRDENAYKVLVRKPGEKWQLGTSRCRSEHNIKWILDK